MNQGPRHWFAEIVLELVQLHETISQSLPRTTHCLRTANLMQANKQTAHQPDQLGNSMQHHLADTHRKHTHRLAYKAKMFGSAWKGSMEASFDQPVQHERKELSCSANCCFAATSCKACAEAYALQHTAGKGRQGERYFQRRLAAHTADSKQASMLVSTTAVMLCTSPS